MITLLPTTDPEQLRRPAPVLDLGERHVQIHEPVPRHLLTDHRDLPRIDPEMLLQHRIEGPIIVLLGVLPVSCHHFVEKDLKGRDEFARTLIHARQANRERAVPCRVHPPVRHTHRRVLWGSPTVVGMGAVVVVGAGVIGLSVAHEPARAGRRVPVIAARVAQVVPA
ncbi:hypothetical protein GCM10009828_053790 [Actinoplanes couchii]|uniref:Uncharacterized protein n=1 Tax=Actinoplanes couchii TaxID=403638 RepID=A0ABQ3XQT8_9ACTN|nr:hypothetical protein Aco03nite_092700 [Actinoplanes couchii]